MEGVGVGLRGLRQGSGSGAQSRGVWAGLARPSPLFPPVLDLRARWAAVAVAARAAE